MAFDPVDSTAIADVKSAFHGFDTDIGGVAKFDDMTIATDAVQEVQDYKLQPTDASTSDLSEVAEKHADTNILAQYFDSTGSIVNRYV